MIIFSIFLSIMLLFLTHPLSMGLILLMQTILICLSSGMFMENYWYSYILMLIMIGGMLVLFIYMTSIASNEKFNMSMNFMFMMIILMTLLLIIYFNNYSTLNYLINNFSTNIYFKNLSMSKFYNYPNNMILTMIIIYLFITLIAVVKISSTKFGPLRQMF